MEPRTEQAVPAGWSRGASRHPLLERDGHLAALEEAARAAVAGHGSLVFVAGEAGIGKTALVRRFADSWQGTPVLTGSCDPLETPRALGPLLDMAQGLGPEFEERVASSPPRAELFAAVVARLRAAPLTLVFEDVHWGDQATLDLLRFVGRRVERLPALIVATYREDEAAGGPAAVLLGDLATAPGVRRLQLAPLSREATGRLAAPTGADADDLHRRTGGNPFFITEALAAGGEEVPATVRDAVLARVVRLSPAARQALEAAAAFGTRLDPEHLAAALDATGTPRWATREAVVAGLLLWQGSRLAFRHELAQSAIAAATPPERVEHLHRVILEVLQRGPVGVDVHADLVRHAEAAGDDGAVLRMAPLAALRAEALNAHREAAALYAKALARARGQPLRLQADLTERRAHQCYLAGQLDEAAEGHRRAAGLWHQAGDRLSEGRNLSRVAALSFLAGRYREIEDAFTAALTCLEALPPGAELAMTYEARARLLFLMQQPDQSASWAERAAALADEVGDTATALNARVTGAAARLAVGDDRARAELDAARGLALERGLEDAVARATTYLGWLPMLHRRYGGVQRYLDEGIAYALDHELGYWWELMAGVRVRWCLDVGRWQEVEGAALEILNLPHPVSLARMYALVSLGLLRARRGEPDPRRCLDEALEMTREHPQVEAVVPVRPARAEAAWLEGDLAAALEEARAARAAGAPALEPWAHGELALWACVAGGAPGAGGPAAEPYRLAVAGEWGAAGAWWLDRGCPYDAALAWSLAEDAELLLRAIGTFDELGARPAAARARQRLRELGVPAVPRGPRPSTSANPAGLTRREQEVLGLVSAGLTNGQIAGRLFLSEKTVERHLGAILRKLDVTSRSAAVAAARRAGALAADDR